MSGKGACFLIMFFEFHFLQFSNFFSFLGSSYLWLLSCFFQLLSFFAYSLLLLLVTSTISYILAPHIWVFQFVLLDAQFFCLSQSYNLSQYIWTKFTFPSYSYSCSFSVHFLFLLFFIFTLFLSILLHPLCLFSSFDFPVPVSCGKLCNCCSATSSIST